MNGHEISCGQKQRLACARAFYRQSARVIILDAPTSAVGAIAEKHIFDSLLKMNKKNGETIFVVAHCLHTLTCVDEIIVFLKGKIVDKGSFKDLVLAESHFYRLFKFKMSTGVS